MAVEKGVIGIYGSGPLQHIAIHIHPMPTDPATLCALKELALSILLASHGAQVTSDDNLVPCFNPQELQKRNTGKRSK